MLRGYLRELWHWWVDGWNRFWFSPADPATLGLLRALAGGMLLYTHAVWSLGLNDFFGPYSWVSPQAARELYRGDVPWSWFWHISSPTLLWLLHTAALVVMAMFALGLFSRVTAVLSWLCAVAYAHRVPGALFGLDQINAMLAMYLMLGPCGAAWSVDRWIARWRSGRPLPPAVPSTAANLAVRLIQVHMCVIYFFAGVSKLQGQSWWAGTALWGAVANLEYQTLDLTWMCHTPWLVALLTQATVWWELFFCVLVWPRLLRPLVLAFAVPLHLGIAVGMGMVTFGLVMLIGCASFVPPWLVRRLLGGGPAVPPAGVESGAPRAGRAMRRRRGARG